MTDRDHGEDESRWADDRAFEPDGIKWNVVTAQNNATGRWAVSLSLQVEDDGRDRLLIFLQHADQARAMARALAEAANDIDRETEE